MIKGILNNDVIQRLKQVDTGVTNELKTLNKNEITLIKVIALESSLSDLHFQIGEIFNLIVLGKQGIISPQIIDPGTFINNYAQVLGSKTVGNAFIPVEVVTTSRKTPHLVFLAFSSAEAIDST